MTSLMTQHEKRFFIMYHDVERICNGDIAGACILRMYEDKNDARARELIKACNIPDGIFPYPDDLWIDEVDLRSSEAWTAGIRCKSTYPRVLADVSPNPRKPSLIQLGFLQRRYIARPLDSMAEEAKTSLYRDERGVFIIVQNANGFYVGDDGALCCARSQGWYVVKQYRYEADKVNTALAKSAWRDPPPPLKRWRPIVQQRQSQKKESVAETTQETTYSSDVSDAISVNEALQVSDARSGGTSTVISTSEELMHSFASEHNTNGGDVATKFPENSLRFSEFSKPVKQPVKPIRLHRDVIDADTLRNAAWCPETIIGLTSLILDIPVKPSDDDEEALQQWCIDWFEPAQRLYTATLDLSSQLAWERLDLTTRYMATPGSPSWWQRPVSEGGRKTKAPVTLKNVADRFFIEYEDFKQHQWWPSETTQYFGPPLEIEEEDDEAGYESAERPLPVIEAEVVEVPDGQITAITEEAGEAPDGVAEPQLAGLDQDQSTTGDEAPERDEAQHEPVTDEVVAVPAPLPVEETRPPGMSQAMAEHLTKRIRQRSPGIILDWQPATDDGERVYVCLEYASEQWVYLGSMSEWLRPSPDIAARIEEAIAWSCGMTVDVAVALIQRIKRRYPEIVIGWRYVSDTSKWVIVGVEYAPEQWLDFNDPGEWSRRTKGQQQLIEQALDYAASLDGGDEPPPAVEEEVNNNAHHEDITNHQGGGIQATMSGGVSTG